MAYNREEIYKQALSDTIEYNLFFISDVIALSPVSKSSFYEFFPSSSEQLDDIKELLTKNRVKEKLSLRKDFKKGSSAERISLYKLIATEEERKALSSEWKDHTSGGDKITTPKIVFE